MRHEETNSQIVLVQWVRMAHPRIIMISSSHAGLKMDARTGALAKRLGYRKGTPDLIFLEPRGFYHGLILELKTAQGSASPEQVELLRDMRAKGYKALIVRGFDEAVKEINAYMRLEPNYDPAEKIPQEAIF